MIIKNPKPKKPLTRNNANKSGQKKHVKISCKTLYTHNKKHNIIKIMIDSQLF